MSRRLAPSARRMPISRVRSVTVASMMFMIPMPPTTSEMPAMAPRMHREQPLRLLGLFQQIERNCHCHVSARVELIDQGLDHCRRLGDVFHVVDGDRQLADVEPFDLIRPSRVSDDFAAEAHRGRWRRE